MCQGVNGEVLPYRWRGYLRAPAEGEVAGGDAYCKVPGRVLGPKGGEGGEGLWESGRGRAGVGGGAGNSEGSKAPLVSAVGDNGGEAGLPGKDGGGGGEEVVRGPSLDPVPEAVQASERGVVWGEEVRPVSEYGKEEAAGNAMAKEGSDDGPRGGEAFDEGEASLGQGKPVPVVVGRVEGGGEPISQPSDHLGGPEEVAFQFDRGTQGRCPLARGSPVDQFGFGDREGHANFPAFYCYGGEEIF